MKKSILAVLCVITAIILAGCNAQVSKKAFSYKFGYVSENANGLLESYSYNIVSEEKTFNANDIKPPYYLIGSGTYTVNLFSLENNLFKLVTDFQFEGKYLNTSDNSLSEGFTDSITSTSFVKIGAEVFTPVSTEKVFETTVPSFSAGVLSIKKAYYTSVINYEYNGIEYNITSDVQDTANVQNENIILMENKKNNNLSLTTKENLVDNEHIFLAIRLQNINVNFTDNIKVFDSLIGIIQTINVNTLQKIETKTFNNTADENAPAEYDCLVMSAALSGINKGSDTVMYFTQDYSKTFLNSKNNALSKNISLMVEFKQGNLIYTLNSYENFARIETTV